MLKNIFAIIGILCGGVVQGFPFLRNGNSTLSASVNVSPLVGDWVQLFNNKYVQMTSEIDYHCVSVVVRQTGGNRVQVRKHALQHGNQGQPIVWNNTYVPSLLHQDNDSFEDNLILTPSQNSSYVVVPLFLRKMESDFLIWTGLDNKTMYVWGKTPAQPTTEILELLNRLDFNGMYKTAVSSYNASCTTL